MVQLPTLELDVPPSKIAISDAPGTEAPPAPLEAVDQFDAAFQLEVPVATQYRFAACKSEAVQSKRCIKRILKSFITCSN
jgi:hypothetical protein